ncbi:Uma2 family endonuclease [Hymenobacter sp. NBH84]|uniref:Uma2 family endonuclease n=1 Tax=Hymenobacter sp. NBH84 TaxID=2596915 RepID=UPI0016239794|nr:Uma2 family endonuclease [Hymenobacter sp. NBH84]QNE39165.1 Uma2 family endonuclease [Hymenobacter sp. NBH84]
MSAQPQPYITPEEYLAAERAAHRDIAGKHEYFQGEVYAMGGASRQHNLLVTNLIVGLDTRIGDACNVYPSDMRVHVASNGLYTYPDVVVACGDEEFLPDAYLDTLLNPVVLVEVSSRSTAQYDQEGKFLLYRNISSLRHYLLVDSQRVRILCITRLEADTWNFREYSQLTDQVLLSALEVEIPVSEIYRKVPLPAANGAL